MGLNCAAPINFLDLPKESGSFNLATVQPPIKKHCKVDQA
jgi:hypothetical protein